MYCLVASHAGAASTESITTSLPETASIARDHVIGAAGSAGSRSMISMASPAANRLASTGTIEVLPLPSPMLLLVLGSNRTLPVRINDFSVVEEAFDVNLNPIRARISLGLRLLSIDDLAYGSKGAELFMVALKRREQLSRRKPPAIQSLGLKTAP